MEEGSIEPGFIVIIDGLEVLQHKSGYYYVSRYVGERNVPNDIQHQRRATWQAMKYMGQPVLIKHMYNAEDVINGIAEASPNLDDAYQQSRNQDPLSYGIGLTSVEKSKDEWIAPDGTIVKNRVQPSPQHIPAPRYRGFGPGYLTYIVEPDAAEDTFKLSPTGAFIKIQNAQAQMGWFPEVNDNDLIINVTLDRNGMINGSTDRFQAKQTNPVSLRGYDRKGRSEYSGDSGNRLIVNQNFEMSLVPKNNVLSGVEVDR